VWRLLSNNAFVITALLIIEYHNTVLRTDVANVATNIIQVSVVISPNNPLVKLRPPALPVPSNTTSSNAALPQAPLLTTTDTTSLTTLAPRKFTKNTTCLLKTAIATVIGSDLQTEANVLFDEGS